MVFVYGTSGRGIDDKTNPMIREGVCSKCVVCQVYLEIHQALCYNFFTGRGDAADKS